MADFETPLMKMLLQSPWQKQPHGPKITLNKMLEALGKLGTKLEQPLDIVESLQNVKGRGWVQTDPKIILKEEFPTAEFQLWLTPLGKTELQKRMNSGKS